MKTITLTDAINKYESDLEVLYLTLYEEDGYNCDSERIFEKLVEWCEKDGYVIENEAEVEYDHPIYDHYVHTDFEMGY